MADDVTKELSLFPVFHIVRFMLDQFSYGGTMAAAAPGFIATWHTTCNLESEGLLQHSDKGWNLLLVAL